MQDIRTHQGLSFKPLITRWEKRWGKDAALPLLSISKDPKIPDHGRYIAVLASAKLGGKAVTLELLPFLKNKVWMIRSAALKALRVTGDTQTSTAALPLLRDPALLVRYEAIETIVQLKPKGAVEAIINSALHKDNYVQGRALWVPQRALRALVELQAPKSVIARLQPLTKPPYDPVFRQEVMETIAKLR